MASKFRRRSRKSPGSCRRSTCWLPRFRPDIETLEARLVPANFTPGNLLLTESVYTGSTSTVTVGQALPGGGTAVADGSYPNVWANEGPDASFGVTSPIYLQQLSPSGTLVGSPLNITNLTSQLGKQVSTSFPSKSEMALNLSADDSAVTFMAYIAAPNTLDVSNSNTPNHIDPTNLVGAFPVNEGTFQRAVVQINADGSATVTPVNAYSGNNGRAAILGGTGNYYMVGNAGNGGNISIKGVNTSAGNTTLTITGTGNSTAGLEAGQPISGGSGASAIPAGATVVSITDSTHFVISAAPTASSSSSFTATVTQTGTVLSQLSDNTGVQMIAPGAGGESTVIGQVNGTFGSSTGYQRGFSVANTNPLTGQPYGAADKTGKDDNFRGLTIFNNTLYVTKGSGSNGIDTVYQVGTSGSLPTSSDTPITVLPGFPTTLARGLTSVDSTTTAGGQYNSNFSGTATEFYPFGIWFANSTTLYVADEGAPVTTSGSKAVSPSLAALDPNAGLQKWSLVNGTWQLDYTLQTGLNLGQSYSIANGPNGEVYPANLNPATAGLRNLTGQVNADGTVTLYAVTSTSSTNTDQGADPNKLVAITDTLSFATATQAASESFTTLKTAGYGEVLRGVSLAPVPAVSITATDASAAEVNADPGTFHISRTGGTTAALTVNYTVSGSANSADYTPALTGTVTIAAGQSSADIKITPVEDWLIEGNETLTLTLASSTTYNIGTASATVTIADHTAGVAPFLGVSAGDADSSSAILWTRVDQQAAVPVTAQVSTDPNFGGTLLTFPTTSDATKDYTAKVAATGLQAGTQYYYRFVIDATGDMSGVGTFKTAPAANAQVGLKFAFSGDEDGLIRPYALASQIPAENLDFYANLGDTIYETASNVAGNNGAGYLNSPSVTLSGSSASLNGVPTGVGFATQQQLFDDYNKKYLEQFLPVNTGGQNGLQPFFAGQGDYTLLDNHELGNRQYINGGAPAGGPVGGPSGTNMPTGAGVDARATTNPGGNPNDANLSASDYMNRSVGFQTLQQDFLNFMAINENRATTPVLPGDNRTGTTKQLFFSQQWGASAIYVQTDTRSYRDLRLKTADGSADDTGARADNPNRTYLGATQLAWLEQTLLTAQQNGTPWKFVTLSDPIDEIGPIGGTLPGVTNATMQPFSGNSAYGPVNSDGGKSYIGGYRAERNALLKFIADNGIENVVFLATDDHQNRINEVTYSPTGDTGNLASYVKVPHVFSIVDGPLGATGPDLFLKHDFAGVQGAANLIANAQIASGVEPIGLMGYAGLHNVQRDQNGVLVNETTPQAVDFYSPDTFNYNVLQVSPDGKTLTVTSKGINSTGQNSGLEYGANGNTLRTIFSFQVDAFNVPPVAQSSGVTTNEDTAKTFAVSDFHFTDHENDSLASITIGSLSLAAGDSLTVDQGAGAVTVTSGMTITAAQIATLTYTPASNASGAARSSFTFTVNDAGLGTVAATMTINVTPVADVPTLHVSPSAGPQATAIPLSINAALTDTDGSEVLSITIEGVPASATLSAGSNLGGGKWSLTPAQLSGLTITTPDAGPFTLHVTATSQEKANGSTASTSADLVVSVSGATLANGVLSVFGTSNGDSVNIDRDSHNMLTVTASFIPGNHVKSFSIPAVSQIIVQLGDGNDVAVVSDNVQVPVLLDGGQGNDFLQAGNGAAILVGGDGNDTLIGGKKRDILIGGNGSDVLMSRVGDDILIAGRTSYDGNTTALLSLLAEWTRTDLDTAHRMAHLRSGGGLNGSNVLTSTTVIDDGSFDVLIGGPGDDWYWGDLGHDLIIGKKKNEVVN